MNRYAIAFDVGGLFTKAAVLRSNGEVCSDSYSIYPSRSHDSRTQLINHFVDMIKQQCAKIMDKYFRISGVGYAFPGPFDYERGISYVTGVDKFESLFGVNIKAEICAAIERDPVLSSLFDVDHQVVFDNDANLFALGEQLAGKARRYQRAICITLGTGIGSAFIEGEQLVKDSPDVPKDGWIYRVPFRDSIVDDYTSNRGILKLARDLGFSADLDVVGVAALARAGDSKAQLVFRKFGEALSEAIEPYLKSFKPDAIVVGGQIAKSQELFVEELLNVLRPYDVHLEFSKDTSRSTFIGVYSLLSERGIKA